MTNELTARPEPPADCVCKPAYTAEAGYKHSRRCEAVMACRAADARGDVDGIDDDGDIVGSVDDYRRIYRDALTVGNMVVALNALNMVQQLSAPRKPLTPEQRVEHERASFARETIATLSAVDGGIAALLTRLVSRGCRVCAGLAPDVPTRSVPERIQPSPDAADQEHEVVPTAVDEAASPGVKQSSSRIVAALPERETSWERMRRLEDGARERMRTMRSASYGTDP